VIASPLSTVGKRIARRCGDLTQPKAGVSQGKSSSAAAGLIVGPFSHSSLVFTYGIVSPTPGPNAKVRSLSSKSDSLSRQSLAVCPAPLDPLTGFNIR